MVTEFAGPKERKSLADYEKRLMAVQVHGEAGWEAGLNKMYTTAAEEEGLKYPFTVFGLNYPAEASADDREQFERRGIAQLINDPGSITWRLPPGVDLRSLLLRCSSSLGPGGGNDDVSGWEDPAVIIGTFGLGELAAATDAYITDMRHANVTLVPFAGSGDGGNGGAANGGDSSGAADAGGAETEQQGGGEDGRRHVDRSGPALRARDRRAHGA